MSNYKQSSIEWLIEKLGKYNEEMIFLYQNEIQQAKAMHKEEIIDAYHANPLESKWQNKGFGYYTETFGCNNEQQ